jgi:hypothetical protein
MDEHLALKKEIFRPYDENDHHQNLLRIVKKSEICKRLIT